ncbi:MAG: hypothetical protein ACK5NB_13715 [Flavobacteriaceae bacterium]
MRIKRNIPYFIILFCFWYTPCSSQDNWDKPPVDQDYVIYNKPSLLNEKQGLDCFEGNKLLEKLMICGTNQLISKRQDFIAFNIVGSNTNKDGARLISFEKEWQRTKKDINLFTDIYWKDQVYYYNKNEVKTKFNADTVLSYSFKLKPEYFYKSRGKNIWVLSRYKQGEPIIRTYCLYDDISEKKLQQYKAEIENAFIYATNKPLVRPSELEAMSLSLNKPEVFDKAYNRECFQDNAKLNRMFTCVGYQLWSKPNNFVVFFPSRAIIAENRDFGEALTSRFPLLKKSTVDVQHVYQLSAEIKHALGDDAYKNWKKHVTYLPQEESLRKFNADTAITYNIKLKQKDYYKQEFGNIWALTIQKKGKGYITLHCLYKDMPEEELNVYKNAVESIFKYH